MQRWFRIFALFAALTASAPAIAMAIERPVAVQTCAEEARKTIDGDERSEPRAAIVHARHAARKPARTTDHLVLVPDRYLEHCALLR